MVPCLSCQLTGLRKMFFTLQRMLAVLRLGQFLAMSGYKVVSRQIG